MPLHGAMPVALNLALCASTSTSTLIVRDRNSELANRSVAAHLPRISRIGVVPLNQL